MKKSICQIPKEKFRGAIWIHDNLDEKKAKGFWSRLTGIPLKQFVVKNNIGSKKVRKKKHPYGIFSLRVSDTKIKRKLMGWMEGVFGT